MLNLLVLKVVTWDKQKWQKISVDDYFEKYNDWKIDVFCWEKSVKAVR